MSARRSGQEQGDGWLGWEREPEAGDAGAEAADATVGDRLVQDQAVETTGPWLRHDAGASGADTPASGADTPASGADTPASGADTRASGEPEAPSPWLAPETSVPDERPSPRDAQDAAVPPTMAGAPSVPRWTPQRPAPAPVAPLTSAAEAPATEVPATEVPATEVPATEAPATEVLPAAYTQPVRVADTDPAADVEDAATGPSRRRGRGTQVDEPDEPARGLAVIGAAVKELAIVVGMALVLSFVVKTWLLQAFYIPSGSMEDTLRINDRVIVSKLTPGPFDLRRGDIIVFADPGNWVEAPVEQEHGTAVTVLRDAMMFVGLLPDDSENHLIKRVIGLPGDHVTCCDAGGRLTVNGQPVKEPYLKPGVAPSDQNFDITVPRGRVWVMGDNRSGSSDSRFHDAPSDDGSLGSVDERLIVGRAVALVWPLDHLTWLSNPSSTFRNVPAPTTDGATDPGTDGGGTDGGGGTGTEGPTTGGGAVDGGSGG